jgi:DNA sulfur modification protein DndB
MSKKDDGFGFVFPAIRGIQANREYYVSMCPLRLIPKMFLYDEAELKPELRAQRTLNKARIPEMSRYLLDNRDNYVFSAITASIDANVSFDPIGSAGEASRVGLLNVPMDAKFIINDGQHRRAAIEEAIRENPDVGDESIAVVFFLDLGLARCQQMFADLNRYAIRPSRSLGVLYDYRDDMAIITKLVVLKSDFFCDLVEMEKSTLAPRSRKLFTLSALYHANCELLDKTRIENHDSAADLARCYWEYVAEQIPEWNMVRNRKIVAGDVRRDFIHSHAVAIHALGVIGNSLLKEKNWRKLLAPIKTLNWSRSNSKLWEGRATVGGTVSKNTQNVTLTVNAIKKQLKLSLTPEEKRTEELFARNKDEE